MSIRSFAAAVVLTAALPLTARAQQNALIGAWELVAQTNTQGEKNPNPDQLVIFTDSGVFTQLELPTGRPRINKSDADMTAEELRARYAGVRAIHGTYTVSGNRVDFVILRSSFPNSEGTRPVRVFTVDRDTLVITGPEGPNGTAENRYRRIRPSSSR